MKTEGLLMDVAVLDTETDATLDLATLKRAFTTAFPAARGQMHVKRLWTRAGVGFYRVNWWRILPGDATYMGDSAFVAVERTEDGLSVRELTRRHAA